MSRPLVKTQGSEEFGFGAGRNCHEAAAQQGHARRPGPHGQRTRRRPVFVKSLLFRLVPNWKFSHIRSVLFPVT